MSAQNGKQGKKRWTIRLTQNEYKAIVESVGETPGIKTPSELISSILEGKTDAVWAPHVPQHRLTALLALTLEMSVFEDIRLQATEAGIKPTAYIRAVIFGREVEPPAQRRRVQLNTFVTLEEREAITTTVKTTPGIRSYEKLVVSILDGEKVAPSVVDNPSGVRNVIIGICFKPENAERIKIEANRAGASVSDYIRVSLLGGQRYEESVATLPVKEKRGVLRASFSADEKEVIRTAVHSTLGMKFNGDLLSGILDGTFHASTVDRPTPNSSDHRLHVVKFWVAASTAKKVRTDAAAAGLSVSHFVRMLIFGEDAGAPSRRYLKELEGEFLLSFTASADFIKTFDRLIGSKPSYRYWTRRKAFRAFVLDAMERELKRLPKDETTT